MSWLVQVLHYEPHMQYRAVDVFTWITYGTLLSASLPWSYDLRTYAHAQMLWMSQRPWTPHNSVPTQSTRLSSFHSQSSTQNLKESQRKIIILLLIFFWGRLVLLWGFPAGCMQPLCRIWYMCQWFMPCIEMKQLVDSRASTGEQVMGQWCLSKMNKLSAP